MHSTKATAIDKSNDVGETEQMFAHSKRETTLRLVQNVLLIWLDSTIDVNNKDCYNTIGQLRRVVNTINTFTDTDQCVEFITNMNNEKACMIISGSLGEYIVPCIHDIPQADSFFIFCGNKKRHEQWAKQWPKIKGVFTEISPMCEAIKQAANQCEHNMTSIGFIDTSDDLSNKDLNQLDSSFMYTQIMKEILLAIKFEEGYMKEFIQQCRDFFVENTNALTTIDQFEREYHDKTPIWWYTCESFLYPILNHALRVMDADIIIKMGFFIGDLHRQIEQLYREQYNKHHSSKTFILYRGQGLSKTDFEQMSKIKGGLMSFNNFLSTSTNRDISVDTARRALFNPDMVGILFVMMIDPSKSTTPFASIGDVSEFVQADEVLFSMRSVFRIDDIKPIGGNQGLFQVDLTLTTDKDKDLRVLTERIQEEIQKTTEWDRLSELLIKIDQPEKAQKVYQVMLDQTDDDTKKGFIYNQLGKTKCYQGEYEAGIIFCEKALDIYQTTPPVNHCNLAECYNTLGVAYNCIGEYSKALSYYEKALEIQKQSLPPNHPDLAISYKNIGNVHNSLGEYSKALLSHQKSLETQKQSLPSNHPDLAASYNDIGLIHENMGEYPKAQSSYEHAVNIAQESLPSNHPNLKKWRNNLDRIKKNWKLSSIFQRLNKMLK